MFAPSRAHQIAGAMATAIAAVAVCGAAAPSQAASAVGQQPASTRTAFVPTDWHTPGYTWSATTPAGGPDGVAIYSGTLSNSAANPAWAVTIFASTTSSLTGQPTSSELGDQQWATGVAERLRRSGATPQVDAIDWPATYTDTPHGVQGWRVRAGQYPTQAQAQSEAATLEGEGFPTATVQWTGYDADVDADAEQVHVAVIDPRRFGGSVTATHGPVVAARTTTSRLARESGATVAVNGGFFVTSDADGFQGVPSGLAAYAGKLQAMSVGDRAALVLSGNGTARIEHLVSTVTARSQDWSLPIDGINRKPGLVRDCGRPGLSPTSDPRQDFTCTAADDAVLFTAQFGVALPSGPGEQVLLDATGRVVSVGARGGTIPADGSAIQAVGAPSDSLARLTAGSRVSVADTIRDDRTGQPVHLAASTAIVSAAPTLVAQGRPAIDASTEGVIDPGDRSFNFAWGEIRQPRTFVGTDAAGRLLLVTVDGREPGTSEGFTLAEEAAFMRELGAVEAMNLDGGGSTAMAVDGQLVNHPSDPTGERADGDAVVVIPPPDHVSGAKS